MHWCSCPLSLLGCLLDFLKSDEGSRLSLPRLIDMSAQVGELPHAEGTWGNCVLLRVLWLK